MLWDILMGVRCKVNDFTRDELEELIELMVHAYGEKAKYLNLVTKIQSMLDNYCDHKEADMDCDGGISLICTQCGYTVMDA